MPTSRTSLAQAINLLTGIPMPAIEAQLSKMSDTQVAAYGQNVSAALAPVDLFTPQAMSEFVARDDTVHSNAEAIAYAATQDPDVVFTGENAAKLDAWALANGYTLP